MLCYHVFYGIFLLLLYVETHLMAENKERRESRKKTFLFFLFVFSKFQYIIIIIIVALLTFIVGEKGEGEVGEKGNPSKSKKENEQMIVVLFCFYIYLVQISCIHFEICIRWIQIDKKNDFIIRFTFCNRFGVCRTRSKYL